MKFIYQDLLKFLSDKPSKELLSNKLFQLGHEHEIHDELFDMELTPNRGDCLSLIGLARDLNIFFGYSNDVEIYENKIEDLQINFQNFSPRDCPKISFLEIEIEEPAIEYKHYLENYFKYIGGSKVNFFADISNYVSYELGQPTHCFDCNRLQGDIVFENKNCNSLFKTLLGSKIQLKGKNSVFSSGNEIISLAGIMGGASTACSKETKKVLVECAYFNPESIIGKSIKYNLTSDAAHKFERGVDFECQEKVLRRFIKVVEDHAKIKSIKYKSFISNERENIYIPIDTKKINKVLGTRLEEQEYLNYLKHLGFKVNERIKVPSYRSDICTQNDLAEEIARIIGYDNITSVPVELPPILCEPSRNKTSLIESFLLENSFAEVINFPFTAKKEKASIKIDNPLDSNRQNFRTSLKDSLIDNLLYNERRQKDSIKLFEISNIYTKDTEIRHQTKLGIIISGRLGNNYNEFSRKLDQKYLDNLLNSGLNNGYFKIQEISRNTIETKRKNRIFYVETFLEEIPESFFSNLSINNRKINFVSYNPISEYPSSTRDFSFSINKIDKVEKVIELLEKISDEIIKESFIFDFYKNYQDNLVKLGYRFIFQSPAKTLSDEEINTKIKEILKPVLEIEGVSVPGM